MLYHNCYLVYETADMMNMILYMILNETLKRKKKLEWVSVLWSISLTQQVRRRNSASCSLVSGQNSADLSPWFSALTNGWIPE